MPTLIDNPQEVRRIALAQIERGRSSTYGYFSDYFNTLGVGDMVALDTDDLDKYRSEASYIVATVTDNATLTPAQRKVISGLTASLRRELRKIHGENADLRYFFGENDNGDNYFAIERVK